MNIFILFEKKRVFLIVTVKDFDIDKSQEDGVE